MTSAIEIVSLSSDNMTSPKKRVRKAIIKPKNGKETLNGAEKLKESFPDQPKNAEKLEQ